MLSWGRFKMNGATAHYAIHKTDALNIDFPTTVIVKKHSGLFYMS